VNSNPDLLNEQIDLHGGLGKKDACEAFLVHYKRIKAGLTDRTIKTNTQNPKNHIIKVICGFGHHSNGGDPECIGSLRKSFKKLIISMKMDFAYIEKHGCFLVRINMS